MSAAALNGGDVILTTYTLFHDVKATAKTERADVAWSELVERLKNAPTYPNKAACPLISLAEYGEQLTAAGCIRHDGNVRRIFGAAIDYDAGSMPIEEAARLLEQARIEAVVVTTPSYSAANPRWRIYAPTGDPELPEKYREYVGRLNRILDGAAASESFDLSRSYFVGRVEGVEYKVLESHGRPIDACYDIEPLYPAGAHKGNGAAGEPKFDPTTDAELRAAFTRGWGRYEAMLKLSSRWAAAGMAAADIAAALSALVAQSPDVHNADGINLAARIAGIAASAVRKYGESRRQQLEPAAGAQQDEAHITPLFNADLARIGLGTFTEIQPPPAFIIDGILPLDVCLQSAPGGTSKSTLQLFQAIHVILKRDFLGRQVLKPGRVLIVSAEDSLRRIKYRAHYLASQMQLSDQELETLGENLLVEDMTGQTIRLAALGSDGNLYQTAAVEHLIAEYKGRNLSLVVLDPYVFFGPGERLVNDGDSIMAQVGARLVRELQCAVLFIAHSGKANAREGRADQYASRGGSALPDGMRMVQVLTIVGPKDTDIPDVVTGEDVAKGRILRLTIPKITDAPPVTEPLYLKRDRFGFEWIENATNDPQEQQLRRIETIRSFIEAQLRVGVRHTRRSLDACAAQVGMKRDEVRRALHVALERGFIIEKELSKTERQGARTHYLIAGAPVC